MQDLGEFWWAVVSLWLLWVKVGLQGMICDSTDAAHESFPIQSSIGHNFLSTCVIWANVGPIESASHALSIGTCAIILCCASPENGVGCHNWNHLLLGLTLFFGKAKTVVPQQ